MAFSHLFSMGTTQIRQNTITAVWAHGVDVDKFSMHAKTFLACTELYSTYTVFGIKRFY